jgi:hypothetical protein
VNDVAQLTLGVEDGRIARQPVAFHEVPRPLGVEHVVVLQGHLVGLARGDDAFERGPPVAHGIGPGRGWVVRKGVKQVAPYQLVAPFQGVSQVSVAGREHNQVGRNHDVRIRHRFQRT